MLEPVLGAYSVFLGSLYGDCREPELVLSVINLEGITGEIETYKEICGNDAKK